MRKFIYLIGIFGITYGLYFFFSKNNQSLKETQQAEKKNSDDTNPYAANYNENADSFQNAMSTLHQSAISKESNESDSKKNNEKKPPLLSTLREEIKQNPHVTPQSLIEYAQNVGKRMEAALSSNYNAVTLFGELQECVEGSEYQGSPSLQAFCISSAERLAQAHPEELMVQYRDMLNKIPEDSSALLKALNDLNPSDEGDDVLQDNFQ